VQIFSDSNMFFYSFFSHFNGDKVVDTLRKMIYNSTITAKVQSSILLTYNAIAKFEFFKNWVT